MQNIIHYQEANNFHNISESYISEGYNFLRPVIDRMLKNQLLMLENPGTNYIEQIDI